MIYQNKIKLDTHKRGIFDITAQIAAEVALANKPIGICHLFLHHTSASIILCENADPLVQQDLEAFMLRLVPDGDPLFKHVDEGTDDMPSHVRTVLTSSFLSIPITDRKLALGTWQGIYIWEHRLKPLARYVTITIYS